MAEQNRQVDKIRSMAQAKGLDMNLINRMIVWAEADGPQAVKLIQDLIAAVEGTTAAG